jgi:hypothetical protein
VNRYTLFADIAGRVALETIGSDRVTAAAIAIATQDVSTVRGKVAGRFPKWKTATLTDAEAAVDAMIADTAAIAAVTVYKDTDAWRQFWADAPPLHDAIVAQHRRGAGFVKPANVMTFWLFGGAFALASAHAIKTGPSYRLVDYLGRQAIERTIVCDSDIKGEENVDVFTSLWERADEYQPPLESMGLRFYTRDVSVTTEDEEPLLFLADYLAGIVHAAFITDPGRLHLPIEHHEAKRLLGRLNESGKAAVQPLIFDLKYADIFGEAYARAIKDAF